ncbi:hypothetical protein MHBO_004871 [Bonamia ostreae]|uniref:Uncharacterized protein n=1 Tax=Bonamia ostreae TaxID=126728 RepID=A0ABV2AUG5_9EUKA
MTNKEKQELKEEIKKEILQELKGKGKGSNFDFKEYKTQVVEDDIKKLEDFMDINK